MRLRFTARATRDLRDIAEYIRRESPRGALRVRAAILQSLEYLVARRYGYIIYYSIDIAVDELVVLTIRHPSQRPPASGA